MLEDFSQHILDVAENSIKAGASEIKISISENEPHGLMVFKIEDNGSGMDEDMLSRVTDPFCTSRTTRRVGLGLPFLKQLSELCEGEFSISSEVGVGTIVKATFRMNSIDLPPLGDIPATIMSLLVSHPETRWLYLHSRGGSNFEMDSSSLLEILGDPTELRKPQVALWIKDYIRENLNELGNGVNIL